MSNAKRVSSVRTVNVYKIPATVSHVKRAKFASMETAKKTDAPERSAGPGACVIKRPASAKMIPAIISNVRIIKSVEMEIAIVPNVLPPVKRDIPVKIKPV